MDANNNILHFSQTSSHDPERDYSIIMTYLSHASFVYNLDAQVRFCRRRALTDLAEVSFVYSGNAVMQLERDVLYTVADLIGTLGKSYYYDSRALALTLAFSLESMN